MHTKNNQSYRRQDHMTATKRNKDHSNRLTRDSNNGVLRYSIDQADKKLIVI